MYIKLICPKSGLQIIIYERERGREEGIDLYNIKLIMKEREKETINLSLVISHYIYFENEACYGVISDLVIAINGEVWGREVDLVFNYPQDKY